VAFTGGWRPFFYVNSAAGKWIADRGESLAGRVDVSRSVTALYDTRAEAEAARQRLAAEVNLTSARIIDKDSHGSGRPDGSLNRVPMSHEDRHAFGEGIRRGGFLLCAEVGAHEDADRIVRLLEESSSVDLDSRQDEWRREGWSPQPAQTGHSGMGGAASAASLTGGAASAGRTDNDRVVAEEHIPIVEEELVVGKREFERGGARVRSYVREVPVHEEVTLREEHVEVERRPGSGQPISSADAAGLMQDRTIEMTETAEEAVVSKEAHVREEVVVRKTAEQHVQQVDETVRHTEVDVDKDGGDAADRSAFGGFGGDRGTNR
jgi:uncharacterized protein (TIGR02271 family)